MKTESPGSRDLPREFRLGPWIVAPERGDLADGATTHRLEPKVMAVLVVLARSADRLVTKQQLVDEVWSGRPVTDEVIARCISALRTHLGDDHRHPRYIETLPKRGYRLLLVPEPVAAGPADNAIVARGPKSPRLPATAVALALAGIAIAVTATWLWLRAPQTDTPGTPIDSIAILPFTNLSEPADQYLADGVSEELTQLLAQAGGLRVAARTSAFRFRDTNLDIRQIAEQLEVDGIIEGSVRRAGDDLRVTAQFIDGRTGFHLWADTFDGTVDDVFGLQERVAVRIRDSVGRHAVAGNRPARSEPASAEAYDLYLRGRHALSRRGSVSLERAVGYFRRAVELDPAYGPAYVELATAYALLPSYSGEDAGAMYDAALATIEIGLGADPAIADAASALHGYIHNKRGQWLDADRAFQAALQSPQVSSLTHQWYSNLLASVGRLAGAREQARQARAMDPLSPVVVSRLAMTSLWADDDEAAARQFALANELGMETQLHTDSFLLLLFRQGDDERIRALTRAPDGSTPQWIDAFLTCARGATACDAARASVAREPTLSPRVRLVVAAVLGDIDAVAAVAALLETDIGAFETELLFVRELAPFREDPRFGELVHRIGLQDYWIASGCRLAASGVLCTADAAAAGLPR